MIIPIRALLVRLRIKISVSTPSVFLSNQSECKLLEKRRGRVSGRKEIRIHRIRVTVSHGRIARLSTHKISYWGVTCTSLVGRMDGRGHVGRGLRADEHADASRRGEGQMKSLTFHSFARLDFADCPTVSRALGGAYFADDYVQEPDDNAVGQEGIVPSRFPATRICFWIKFNNLLFRHERFFARRIKRGRKEGQPAFLLSACSQ